MMSLVTIDLTNEMVLILGAVLNYFKIHNFNLFYLDNKRKKDTELQIK